MHTLPSPNRKAMHGSAQRRGLRTPSASSALSARSQFGRLLAMGVILNFFFYIMINGLMVMGLIPVVGIPMPLLSYGGSAMLTVMLGFGLLLSVHIHRQVEIPRHSGGII